MTPRTRRAAVLFGATSEIGTAVVRELLAPASCLVLAGRPSPARQAAADALRLDHAVSQVDWDALEGADPATVLDKAAAAAGQALDLVVIAAGTLPPGVPDLTDPRAAADLREAWLVNAVAPAAVLVAAVQHLAATGGGQVILLSSAAAARPRRQILTYALAKQSVDALARGLQAPAREAGVDVHVVRPGHVLTRMTQGLAVPPLARTSAQVAQDVSAGVARGLPVIWSPPAMRLVVGALTAAPQAVLPRSLR